MTVKEFCMAHGGHPGHVVNISDKFGFTSLQTVDGTCFLSFAKTQFPQDMSKVDVKNLLKTKELDVLVYFIGLVIPYIKKLPSSTSWKY